MPVNRYDQPIGQRYVSTYVPLPFQELASLGEHMQKNRMAKEDEMSQLEKMIADTKVANQVLSEGSEKDLGLKYRDTGYGDFKNQLIDKARTAHQQITDDYTSGKLTHQQLIQKTNQFNNQFKQDFQKLKVAEANSANIFKQDEEYRKHKQVGQNPFLANQLGAEGSRLLQDPFNTDYKGASIGDALDLEKTKNEYADKFKSQILSSGAGKSDQFGNVIYTDKSGVTKQRIVDSVNSTFDQDPMLGTQTKEQTNRWLRDNGYDWNSKVKLNNGQEVKAGDYYYNNIKEDFISGVVAKAEQSDMKKQIRSDIIGAENREAKKIADSVVGNPIESRTFDLSNASIDPNFKSLKDDGIFKQNESGLFSIDYGALHGSTPVYGMRKHKNSDGVVEEVYEKIGEKSSTKKHTELNKQMFKMAKVLGYNKPVTTANFDEIINQYNAGSKMRIADEQMADPVREIETGKLENNWNNYEFFNTDDPLVPLKDKPVMEKGDKVKLNNFRNIIKNGKAEMYRDGFIKKSNGEIIPIMTKPAAIIDDNYHNAIANANLLYTQTDLNQKKIKKVASDGTKVIEENIPISNKGVVDILRTTDESGRNRTVFKYKPLDGSQSTHFYTQADFQQAMNSEYYKLKVGQSEVLGIGSKKNRFDAMDNDEVDINTDNN